MNFKQAKRLHNEDEVVVSEKFLGNGPVQGTVGKVITSKIEVKTKRPQVLLEIVLEDGTYLSDVPHAFIS